MKINIMLFGQLKDIAGRDSLILEDIADTDSLVATLHKCYPTLAKSKYMVAVDKQIISTNTSLTNGCTIALLPPFSGG